MVRYLNKNLISAVSVLLPILAMLVSCGPERMIGYDYINNSPKGSILLIRPEFIYKNKFMPFDSAVQMSESEKDSVAYYRSSYLQYVSDSAFLDEYMNNIIDRLISVGFDVYAQEYVDSFLIVRPPFYLVKVAQLQMEELRDTRAYESLNGIDTDRNIFPSGLVLNALRLNSWIEVTGLDADSGKVKKLFFASNIASNGVKIECKIIQKVPESERQCIITIDTLTLNNLYELARQSGKTYGSYLIDYLMNEYILLHMPDGISPEFYLHYDAELHRIKDSRGEGFQEIESGE